MKHYKSIDDPAAIASWHGLPARARRIAKMAIPRICKPTVAVLVALALVAGCSSKPQPAQISGKVTFKGEPVPAGWISFTPDVASKTLGEVKVFQIQSGTYDSAKQNPPGIPPGQYFVKIAGFDGKKIPMYGQGKQIFNPVDDKHTVEPGTSTKDFVVPTSAGENVRIQPTADQ